MVSIEKEDGLAYGYRIGMVPLTTVQRLPSYPRAVRAMPRRGREGVSSNRLGELLDLDPALTGQVVNGTPVTTLCTGATMNPTLATSLCAALPVAGH